MRRSCERGWLRPTAVAMTPLGCLAVQTGTAADLLGNTGAPLGAAAGEPNDLRWDLAKGFAFEWSSVELSTQAIKSADVNSVVRTLTVSLNVDILNVTRLVTIDVNTPAVIQALDEYGNVVEYEPDQHLSVRRYEDFGDWRTALRSRSFKVVLRWPKRTNQSISSISQLKAYVYALYADDIIAADIPLIVMEDGLRLGLHPV